ncbi:MAG: PAS domain-containing protein, partial [Mucilaginibacter sp.]
KRYSDVFHFSPLPTWIVDLDSLKFMDVNRATIDHYGYSREEFLAMTLKDIRPPEEISKLEQELDKDKNSDTVRHKIMIHKKKDGTLMNVEIQIAPFQYKGAKRSIVIATDITERLKYIKAIEEQNEKLITISWMQSHMVRAPLTRIMALIPMIKDAKTNRVDKEKMIDYLLVSADELDTAIKNITEVTSTVAVK